MSQKIISLFNNKGGVGKTTILWNLSVSLAHKNLKVLVIDYDPQCNLSIAMLGDNIFSDLLKTSSQFPYGKTIKAFALPFLQQNTVLQAIVHRPKNINNSIDLDIIAGDFWLNNFADYLNVGNDIVSGSGLYRFLMLNRLIEEVQKSNNKLYDVVLIDLPPSFNTLVRSALYSSDYFFIPCTPDLFSAYCVGLIGEVLPSFILDWEQGKQRYLYSTPDDGFIPTKGQPKFGGWIYNGFDTRRAANQPKINMTGADRAQYNSIQEAVDHILLPSLSNITAFNAINPNTPNTPIGNIEDLNVMAPDSIVQNIPIKYLQNSRPTRNIGRGAWASNQKKLMNRMSLEYDKIADHVINNL